MALTIPVWVIRVSKQRSSQPFGASRGLLEEQAFFWGKAVLGQVFAALLLALVVACSESAKSTPVPNADSLGGRTAQSPSAVITPAPTATSASQPPPTSPPGSTSPPITLPPATPSPVATSSPTTTQESPTSTLTLTAAEIQGLTHPGIKSALKDVNQRLGEKLDYVHILVAEQATWPDASLGCPAPGQLYAQVLTPGVKLVLSYKGQQFDYRITGQATRLCSRGSTGQPLEQQPLEAIWSRLAELPTPRSEVAAAGLDGKIYVMGGFGAGATANEEYDPAANTWRQRAPIPRGVDHAAAVGVNNKIYLIGGFDGRGGPVNNVWAYDPKADAWTAKAGLPTPRGALGAAAAGGKIYAIGGRDATQDLGTTEQYDPATDTWLARSAMSAARDHIAVAAVGERIYVVGGRLGSYARNLGVTEEYDPRSDAWTRRATLPTPRSGIAAATYQGRIYVFGGEATEGAFNENERYEPTTDAWGKAPPLPTARHGLVAVALNNRIYVLAGGPTPGGSVSALNEVFILFPWTTP